MAAASVSTAAAEFELQQPIATSVRPKSKPGIRVRIHLIAMSSKHADMFEKQARFEAVRSIARKARSVSSSSLSSSKMRTNPRVRVTASESGLHYTGLDINDDDDDVADVFIEGDAKHAVVDCGLMKQNEIQESALSSKRIATKSTMV